MVTNAAGKLISLDDWRAKARAGEVPQGILRKQFIPIEVKADEGAARRVSFVISNGSVDRDRDTIAVDGWKLDNYLKNPVVLWAHDHWGPPIGKAVTVGKDGGALRATAEFATAEEYHFADTVYRLVKGGYLRATSVGFWPSKYLYNEERGGYDFAEQELREFSIVPVPSNPEALAEAKSAGIDLAQLKAWAEEMLEKVSEPGLWIPRATAERVLKLAAGEPASVSVPAPAPEPAAPVKTFVLTEDAVRAATRAAVSGAVDARIKRAQGRLD